MRRFFSFLSLIALTAAPILAQESNLGAGKPADEPNIFWETINFLILAGLLGWLIVKNGGPALRARSQEIHEGLAAGEKAKAEAEARAAQVRVKLGNLENEVAAIRASAGEEREREAERIRRESKAEMDRIRSQAEQEIAGAGKFARMEVQRFAATLAIHLAEQKIRTRMSPDTQSALLESFLADLPRQAAADSAHAG